MKTINNIIKIIRIVVFWLLLIPLFGIALPCWFMAWFNIEVLKLRSIGKMFAYISVGIALLNVELIDAILPRGILFDQNEVDNMYDEIDDQLHTLQLL